MNNVEDYKNFLHKHGYINMKKLWNKIWNCINLTKSIHTRLDEIVKMSSECKTIEDAEKVVTALKQIRRDVTKRPSTKDHFYQVCQAIKGRLIIVEMSIIQDKYKNIKNEN